MLTVTNFKCKANTNLLLSTIVYNFLCLCQSGLLFLTLHQNTLYPTVEQFNSRKPLRFVVTELCQSEVFFSERKKLITVIGGSW